MTGVKNLRTLIRNMSPELNKGEYIFLSTQNPENFSRNDILFEFKEKEGSSLIISKDKADILKIPYTHTSAWITLSIHSSLEAIGLTASFATALSKNNISCNVIAGYYHDHIFVNSKDANKAIETLRNLSLE